MATNFQSITYQDDLTRDIELHNQMLNGVISTYSIEKRYIRKNRSTVWINLTVSPVKNDSGDLEYIISIIEDISDRKRVEADLQASEQLARKTANQLRLVHQIGTAITTGLDLEKLILTLYEECLHISDVDTFYIALYDETTGRLSFPINFKDGKQCAIPERNIKDEPGMVGYIIEGRKTLYIPNQSFIPSGIFPIKQPGIPTVSYLGIPLIVNDRVVGVFSIQSHALDAYTPDQIHTYELLAVPIALAIQNSLLYEQAQDEMHLSNALIDYQPGAFCLIDQQLKIVRWNKYAETLMGYTPEEAANLHLEDLFAVDEWDHITGLIDDVFNGKQVSFETQLKTKHGNLITMVMNATFYTAGDQTYLLAFGIDITDRKQAELEVRKSNERIERILHNLQDAYFQADLEGKFILVSPSAALLYRFNSSEEMVGLPAETLYADNTDRLALINKLRESSQLKDFRCKGLRKDGTTFWVSMNVQFVRDDSGQIIGTEGLVRDITEQYQFEEILLEKDLQFQSITATSPEPILVSRTSDGTILYANEQCGKMIGTSSDNLINQQTPDFYTHPSDRQTFLAMLKQGYVTNWEVSLKRLDGTDFWALVSARLGIFNGQEVIYAGIRDITEHKLAECELREREELFHSAFQSAIAGICMVDMEGKFIRVNQALCEILGYAEEELIQLRFHDVTLDEDRKTEIEIMDQLVAGEIDYARFEKRYIKKNKQIIWVTISTSAIHDNKGNPIYIVKYIQDITETKLANQKLQLREERYRSLVETQLGLISRSDVEGNLTFVNDAYCEAHGKSREELLSSSQHQYIHPEDLDLAAKAHKSLLEPPHHYIIEHRHITPKGMRWYRCEGSVIFDINGNILETQSVGTDIHDLKQSQNEMLNILEKLQKTLEGTIQTIDLITEARDPYTSGHQKRVAELSVAVAKELALPEDQIQGIYYAGLIHDLGKIQIPSEMLSKPGKLSKLEFDLIKTHPEAGYNMLKRIEFPWPLAEIVYQHHERMDGSGYPQKLKGDEILLEARIIGVADVIEAMSSHRPYRPALGMNVALEEIKKNKSILYDEKVTEVFIELIEQGYVFDS